MLSDTIPEVGSVELEIPNLGKIQGLKYDNKTCQYLGIPYADIPGRFRKSIPAAEPWDGGVWDGTKLGPYCPQPPRDFYPIPAAHRPWLETPGTDEFKCLNLNISVPRLPDSENATLLPVMVFFHGGAFVYASGSSPIYDGRILSQKSLVDLKRPTIIITLNYRLGVYGFLAGRDLEEYNKNHGESGVGNYGIWDQVLALRWIQKHITSFGGDPRRVTVFGQSAGAVSVECHLRRNEPLFSSAILQSGLIRLCGVYSIDEYQIIYEKMLIQLGISLDLTPSERIKKFLQVPEKEITAAMTPVFITPVITLGLCDDLNLLPEPIPTSAQYPDFKIPDWCPEIMMGDAINECIIWNRAWDIFSTQKPLPLNQSSTPTASLLIKKVNSYLGPEKAQKILDLYKINEETPPAELFTKLEKLTSHGMYNQLHYFAEKSKPSIYAYHFDVPSPYDNVWGGMAHHSFDNVMIWGVLKHTLPESYFEVAKMMTEAWVKFANGEEPWESVGEKERWMVFGVEGVGMRGVEEDGGRGYGVWEELEREGLVADLEDLSVELCLRRSELVGR